MNTAQQLATLAEGAKAKAHAVLGKLPVLGPVAWLMMQEQATRHTLLSDFEWRVLPPLVLEQANLYVRDDAPLAFVSWAVLSPAAAQRYAAKPHQLAPADWRSGDADKNGEIWIVDLIAPFGGAQEVIKDLRNTLFGAREIRQLVAGGEQHPSIITWPA